MAIWKEGRFLSWYAELGAGLNLSVFYNPRKLDPNRPYEAQVFGYHTTRAATREEAQQAAEGIARKALSQALAALDAKDDEKDGETMSNDMTQPPADVRERIKAAIRDGVRYVAKADGAYLYEPSVDETADRILALLRTPRSEGAGVVAAASAYLRALDTYRKGCRDREIPLAEYAYDEFRRLAEPLVEAEERLRAALRSEAQGDAKALAALIVHIWTRCKDEGPHYRETDEFWEDFERAYQLALLRTPRGEGEASGLAEYITCMGCGQEFDPDDDAQARYHEAACEIVDYEPARVEIARRLRGAALRSDAQGEDTIPVSALRSEIALLRKHRLLPYLAWARLCALAGGVPVGEDTPAALRSEAQGEEV